MLLCKYIFRLDKTISVTAFQDWLNRETDDNAVMLNDLFMAQRWLQQMGRGAEQFGTISIQYCTSYSRHMLQALEIPVVTQVSFYVYPLSNLCLTFS